MRGGWRPGGGRPKGIKETKPRRPRKKKVTAAEVKAVAPKPQLEAKNLEAAEYLRTVWNNPAVEVALRIRAAEIIVRVGGVKGKKETAAERAKAAGSGKFASMLSPFRVVKPGDRQHPPVRAGADVPGDRE